MALIDVEHPTRLRSPAEVAAFYRALDVDRVDVQGWRTEDAAAIARLVAAIDVDADAAVSLDGGGHDGGAWQTLQPLVTAGAGFLDLVTPLANLSVWPTHARVLAPAQPGGYEPIARALGMMQPLIEGDSVVDGVRVIINPQTHWVVEVQAPAPRAFAVFAALGGATLQRGTILRPNARTKELLPAFLHAVGAVVSVRLTLDIDRAAAVAAEVAAEQLEFQAAGVIVRLPPGSIISGYTSHQGTSLNTGREKKEVMARLTKALARAGLGH